MSTSQQSSRSPRHDHQPMEGIEFSRQVIEEKSAASGSGNNKATIPTLERQYSRNPSESLRSSTEDDRTNVLPRIRSVSGVKAPTHRTVYQSALTSRAPLSGPPNRVTKREGHHARQVRPVSALRHVSVPESGAPAMGVEAVVDPYIGIERPVYPGIILPQGLDYQYLHLRKRVSRLAAEKAVEIAGESTMRSWVTQNSPPRLGRATTPSPGEGRITPEAIIASLALIRITVLDP